MLFVCLVSASVQCCLSGSNEIIVVSSRMISQCTAVHLVVGSIESSSPGSKINSKIFVSC